MKLITLTSFKSQDTLYFTVPDTGVQWVMSVNKDGTTNLIDGRHNNGGWNVCESPETILAKLNAN